MASYIPQVVITTEFTRTSTATESPLRACIVGPRAYVADDSPLGTYDPDVGGSFGWPGGAAGGIVDFDSVELSIGSAGLAFLDLAIGGGATVARVSGTTNQVSVSGAGGGFAASGAGHPRMPALYSRDVRKGDRARLSVVSGGATTVLDTYVLGLAATVDPAVVGSLAVASTNQPTQGPRTMGGASPGDSSCFTATFDGDSWSGLVDGLISDSYTITITRASTGGDPSTATASLRSTSGLDDVASFVPGADDVFKTVGRRGLKVKFKAGTGPCDLAVGEAWDVVVEQDYDAAAATSGGSYLGAVDDVYVVEVSRGGDPAAVSPAARPQLRVTTARGGDSSGAITLDSAGGAIPIGTQGVTLTMTDPTAPLAKGDRFLIEVSAAKPGALDRLVLADPLPTEMLSAASIATVLYVPVDRVVPRVSAAGSSADNYSTSSAGISVVPGWTLRDPRFTDAAGAPRDLRVLGGDLRVTLRAWMGGADSGIGEVADLAALATAIPGPIDPRNPLKYALSKALGASGGVSVKYVEVADPGDGEAWAAAIAKLAGRRDVYNVVPLTLDPEIQTLFHIHVASTAAPGSGVDQALVVGIAPAVETTVAVGSTVDPESPVMATISTDPNSFGTAYVLVRVPANDAGFATRGVRAGDEVRYGFDVSAGVSAYASASVAAVVGEAELLLKTGPTAPVPVPSRIEVWRKASPGDMVDDLAARAGGFGDRRAVAVWSDLYDPANPAIPSYFLAAAVAGLASGALPHAGLTNVEVVGFGDTAAARGFLSEDLVDRLCGSGVWLVSRDPDSTAKPLVTRLATTTDASSIEAREEMVRRNVDSLIRTLRARLKPYLGVTNVTESSEMLLRVEVAAFHKRAMTMGWSARLGAQLRAGDLESLAQDLVFADRFVLVVNWLVPSPLNGIWINIPISI